MPSTLILEVIILFCPRDTLATYVLLLPLAPMGGPYTGLDLRSLEVETRLL